jgi:hypothetical protein
MIARHARELYAEPLEHPSHLVAVYWRDHEPCQHLLLTVRGTVHHSVMAVDPSGVRMPLAEALRLGIEVQS